MLFPYLFSEGFMKGRLSLQRFVQVIFERGGTVRKSRRI